ncbi:MAG: Isoprenyl transferase [Candidatus Anoxychlamydiales bacterium]|nr:Isoprenyl transferase [Candidatus Anoxychlamydiales bacterium]NGX35454.1 Isoprenyl transferase [Candidatus Anoxychlamydiales bacterium]
MLKVKVDNFNKKDLFSLDKTKIPKHIAIIMDGNRRWAKKRSLPAIIGHSKGAETLTSIVKTAAFFKIKVLTVYAFSTENWSRSQSEINHVMRLFVKYLKKQLKFLIKEKVRLNIIGDLSLCPQNVQESFIDTIEKTKDGDKLDLVIAINYGARDEIKRAIVKILNDYDDKKISKSQISSELIDQYLDTNKYPDPDLLIRTGGELRISNFLLWQLSYAELYITNVLWPDFNQNELLKAILEFQRRKRRFGA